MKDSISKRNSEYFEASHDAAEDYLAYISRQEEDQTEELNGVDLSLNAVMEEVRKSGMVTALAAREALESHSSIMTLLTFMTKAQGRLAELVADIKINGGGGGIGEGKSSNGMTGAMTGWKLGQQFQGYPLVQAALTVGGAIVGGSIKTDAEYTKWYEEERPYSVSNKALDASKEAEKLAAELSGIAYEEPSNDPPLTDWFMTHNNLPPDLAVPTSSREAAALLDEIKTSREAASAKKGEENTPTVTIEYDDNSEYDNLKQYYGKSQISTMQPQSVQIVTQQPAAESAAPQQTVNLNLQNDFKGNWQDRRQLDDVGEALARQIMDRLNSGGMLYSNNW